MTVPHNLPFLPVALPDRLSLKGVSEEEASALLQIPVLCI
jgi:hypothetical protein